MPIKIRDLNKHLVCGLCGGYYVDATTITECLHSFCRSCIVTYLVTNKCCPRCKIPVHKSRPLLGIRSDKPLQDVVCKIVPDLLEKEEDRKRKFYDETGVRLDDCDKKKSSAVSLSEKTEQHCASLSLEHDNRELTLANNSLWRREHIFFPKRYLRCYDAVSISHVNSLVRRKLPRENIQVITFCRGEVLPETYSLMDVAKTFSWKSDRPLSLTYMVFTSKNRKRTASEEIETKRKKIAKKTLVESVVPEAKSWATAILSDGELAKSNGERVSLSEQDFRRLDTGSDSSVSEAKNVQLKLSQPCFEQEAKIQAVSQNGGKNISYTVMNVPLQEAVASSVAGVAGHANDNTQPVVRDFQSISSSSNANEIASTSDFAPQQTQGPERVKSINSIANRLQIQRKLQKERVGHEKAVLRGTNLPNVLRVTTQPPHNSVSQLRSSWAFTDATSAKTQFNHMAQMIDASAVRNQNRDGYPNVRALERVQKIVPGSSEILIPPPSERGRNDLPTSSEGNCIHLQHTKGRQSHSQVSDTRRKTLQQRGQARPPYRDIRPKIAVSLEGRPFQNQPRFRRHASVEDTQLLTSARQLASLRQQQKILNEIAAVVRGSSNSLQRSESIRAALSSLSPRMTLSAPISSVAASSGQTASATKWRVRSASVQPRPSVVPPKTMTPQIFRNQIRANRNSTRALRPKDSSFYEVPRSAPNHSFSSRREGVDIYQNTIAKARAQVREMSMRDAAMRHRAQIAPYGVHRPVGARNTHPTSVLIRPLSFSSRPVPITPEQTSRNSFSPLMSPTPNYGRLTTRLPPPPQKLLSTGAGSPFSPTRRVFSPPPSAYHAKVQHLGSLPEQDQPLCLVVKK